MISKRQQNHFTGTKIFSLENRMAVAFLLALHGEGNAILKIAHLFRLAEQRRIFLEPLEIGVARAAQIITHHFLFAGLDDDANLLNAGGFEFEQVIMKQRAGDAVRTDHRKHFLLHRVRRREMARAESGDGDDGFANFHFQTSNRFQPFAPKA